MRKKITCSTCNMFIETHRMFKSAYCLPCKNAKSRATRKKYSELSIFEKEKADCRTKTYLYIKREKLIKENCSICNSPDSEAHHPDYSKPLEVVWLCRLHHVELHDCYQ